MTKKNEIELGVAIDENSVKNVKQLRSELKGLLDDAKARELALKEIEKENFELAKDLGSSLASLGVDVWTKDVTGGLMDVKDIVLTLFDYSEKKITYLERIQNKLIEICKQKEFMLKRDSQ